MSTVFKISYTPPPLEELNQLAQLPPIPLPISPPNLAITRRLIFRNIPSTSFSPTSSPTTFSIVITRVKPTWDQICVKVRSQFHIPTNVYFGLTYLDLEGEEIILSSQEEMDEYFFQYKDDDGSSKNFDFKFSPNYKFGLKILSQKNNVEKKEVKKECIDDGQLDFEVYDDDYSNDIYNYGYDDEYTNTRDGCSQQ